MKKYIEFINENTSSLEYYEHMKKILNKYICENGIQSFRSAYYNCDFDDDIRKLKQYICDFEYNDDMTILDNFMINYKDRIFKDSFFTENSGFFDVLLYSYDKNFILSGDKLTDSDEELEYLIKYEYGYQNFDLGRKYLKQSYDNIEEFYFDCADKFVDYYEYMEGYGGIDKNLFSISDKKNGYSICVINLNLYYKNTTNFIFSLERFIEIREDYLNNNKYPYKIEKIKIDDYTGELKYEHILIVGFGENINLSEIRLEHVIKYHEQIDINVETSKYNL